MTVIAALELGRNAMFLALLLSAPMLGAALIVGLVVSIFQAVTQVNEFTLTFVPKILAVILALGLFGSWMANNMLSYTTQLFLALPTLVR